MNKIISVVLMLFITIQLQAQSYEREYTYNASENDSKTSARKAALDALKVELVEEVGISVMSSMEESTQVNDDDVKSMIKSKIKTFSIAMTKTEILDEKWNGESFWIKVKIDVDSDKMKQEVKKSIEVTKNKANEALLEPLRKEILTRLYNLRTPKKIRSVTSKAVKLPMKGEKNIDLHKNILSVFTKYSIEDSLYREFLFSTLKEIKPQWRDDPALWIFAYLAKSSMYTKDESEVLLDFFARMQQNMPRRYYANFFAPAKTNKEIMTLADAYVKRLHANSIGRPTAVSMKREFPTLLRYLPDSVAKDLVNKWKEK